MFSWKAENPGRLLTEIKNYLSGRFTVKEIKWAIDHNQCFVNKKMERFGSTQIKKGDQLFIRLEKQKAFQCEPQRIIFEDEALLLYDKPPFISSEELGKILKCHLVHRLDRDTTGLFLLAKTAQTQSILEKQFRTRFVEKEYLALVEGETLQEGKIAGRMSPVFKNHAQVIWALTSKGLWSETDWKCIARQGKYSLLLCRPTTGRTHQIRVHLASMGHPIVGDPIYGSRKNLQVLRPLLHATSLKFQHPLLNKKVVFHSNPPSDFLIK